MDQMHFDSKFRSRVLIALQKAIVENFQEHDWKEFGYATGHQDFIRSHKRLLRSLSWQDEDYGSCVFDFLEFLVSRDVTALYKMVEHQKLRPHLEKHALDVLSELGLSDAHVPALPLPQISASEVVRRALADAESLLASNGATSAVDRLHTALHGYLRSACADARIAVATDASITTLLKTLRTGHPSLKDLGVHSAELVKVLNSFGNIVDALNTLRNHASVAHANENLLEEDEALLVVNAVRTLFNYLVKKLG
ncbi:abortive infection family protein [Rhodanobacter sp. C05]|uniref:abortive infection family protein n=1 Tax=Rhodanobacter sp. C05 TaxID=1945855 RepID=UPI0009C96563|nr:abortive infection family protein [Rhodanobacter sp. C05]OOG43616.1 hypothetical protein B0E51_02175 [Rhodanobacter sp. C05]